MLFSTCCFPQSVSVGNVFAIASTIVLICVSFLFHLPIVTLIVFLPKLAFRLQPIVQLATVNSATFEVNFKRSLADLCQRCSELDQAGCPSSRVSLSHSTLPLAH